MKEDTSPCSDKAPDDLSYSNKDVVAPEQTWERHGWSLSAADVNHLVDDLLPVSSSGAKNTACQAAMEIGEIRDNIIHQISDDKVTLSRIVRVNQKYYTSAIRSLWRHASLEDLSLYVPFAARRIHYASLLGHVNNEWKELMPLDKNLRFDCVQTLDCWHGSLPDLAQDRLDVLAPALQSGLHTLNIHDTAKLDREQPSTHEDSLWFAKLLCVCPNLKAVDLWTLEVDAQELNAMFVGRRSLRSVSIGPTVAQVLQPAAIPALASLEHLEKLLLHTHLSLPDVEAAARRWQTFRPFASLRIAEVGFEEGSGRAASIFFQDARQLEDLNLALGDAQNMWSGQDDQAMEFLGRLGRLQNLTIEVNNDLQLEGTSLLAIRHLEELRSVEIRSSNPFQEVTANVSMTAGEFIHLLKCLKKATSIHADQVDVMGTMIDPVFSLRREFQWAIESPPHAIHHPPVPDPEVMLGINANYVPGGNPIKLLRPIEATAESKVNVEDETY